ncbi:nuclease-related domain-containing protein [Microbacterium lacticum]
MSTEIPPQNATVPLVAAAPTFGTFPAASVMSECLRLQAEVLPRSPLARFFGRSPLSDESQPWYLGTIGELDVASRLGALADDWTVVHAVPIGTKGSDTDHVVVGAAGVFTINTKHHEGARVWVASRRLLVNGQKTDHLRNTRFEASRTATLLSSRAGFDVPVRGAIVIVGAREIKVREQPDDVAVVAATQLARWLRKQRPHFDATQYAMVSTLVRDAATWTQSAPPAPDLSRFDALRREVAGARRVRMLWGGTLLVGILAITAPMAITYYSSVFGG